MFMVSSYVDISAYIHNFPFADAPHRRDETPNQAAKRANSSDNSMEEPAQKRRKISVTNTITDQVSNVNQVRDVAMNCFNPAQIQPLKKVKKHRNAIDADKVVQVGREVDLIASNVKSWLKNFRAKARLEQKTPTVKPQQNEKKSLKWQAQCHRVSSDEPAHKRRKMSASNITYRYM